MNWYYSRNLEMINRNAIDRFLLFLKFSNSYLILFWWLENDWLKKFKFSWVYKVKNVVSSEFKIFINYFLKILKANLFLINDICIKIIILIFYLRKNEMSIFKSFQTNNCWNYNNQNFKVNNLIYSFTL